MPIVSATRSKGFTLVELIVSVGLFAIVVTITMTAYLRLISIERRARTVNDLTTNISLVVESMTRGIRTGSLYKCNNSSANCPAGGALFSYTDDSGSHTVAYSLVSGTIMESYDSGGLIPLTDPRISIQKLTFYLIGNNNVAGNDGVIPQVVFVVQGTLKVDANTAPTVLTIESAATQRKLDL